MAKDKEKEEKKATKEEKKKVTKKASKKTAKKKVTKKAAKKVAQKTVAKKTVTKKAATKKTAIRKKPAEKKPIKLKEDSKDLDSFAVHAAESADNNIEVAKQPEAVSKETANKAEKPAPAPEQPVSKPVTPAPAKTEPVTSEPYLKRPPASAKNSADKGEGGLFRLIFVVLLFAGVAYYIDEIYDENQSSAKKAPVAAKQVSEPDKALTPASPAAEVITELKPVEETVAQPEVPAQIEQVEQQAALEKTEPVPPPVTVPVVSEAEAASSVVGSAVEPKQETLQAPVLVPVPAPASALQPASTGFPPPPVPEFLTKPAQPQQLPEDQMQLIMQTFGPAAD